MKEYIVTAPFVGIKVGQVLVLSDEQIKRRKALVKKTKKGAVEVIGDFHLKFGETFKTKEEINKNLVKAIESKKEYDEKPIEEKIEQMSYHQQVKFAKEKTEIERPGRMKADDLKNAIIGFFAKKDDGEKGE